MPMASRPVVKTAPSMGLLVSRTIGLGPVIGAVAFFAQLRVVLLDKYGMEPRAQLLAAQDLIMFLHLLTRCAMAPLLVSTGAKSPILLTATGLIPVNLVSLGPLATRFPIAKPWAMATTEISTQAIVSRRQLPAIPIKYPALVVPVLIHAHQGCIPMMPAYVFRIRITVQLVRFDPLPERASLAKVNALQEKSRRRMVRVARIPMAMVRPTTTTKIPRTIATKSNLAVVTLAMLRPLALAPSLCAVRLVFNGALIATRAKT